MPLARRFQALGRMKTGRMNRTESRFAEILRGRELAGEVLWWKFEALKFRLADNTFYTPDFIVLRKDGHIEAYEVKGFWTDDARVKVKVAADLYPLEFIAVRKTRAGWQEERF